ncbi:MAG: hypothetical protein FWD53_00065 [Phycisphaerales bacterium]|nr:hypothetical protein [Phycisphaerales bacterium]
MNEIDPDFSRVVRAVRRDNPDRVPLFELLVDFAIQSQFLGRTVTADDLPAQVEFWSQAGYDYIPLVMGMMRPGRVTEDSAISRMLRERQKEWNLELTSVIGTHEEFETFPWDVAGQVELDDFRKVRALLPPKMKTIALSGKIFTLSWMLMGFENFCESLMEPPPANSLAVRVIQRVAEIQLSALDELLAMEHVGAVCAVDDIAYNTGPMISPDSLRQHIFPWYREIARRCHGAGRLFFMHSDGNMELVLEDLIDLGLDALHPIDPTAMNIAHLKQTHGNRLALFGNVDTELLRSGSSEQVAERVRELLRAVGPGGGFGLGSGNSVPEWATLANYQAMRQTTLEYGKYPIVV